MRVIPNRHHRHFELLPFLLAASVIFASLPVILVAAPGADRRPAFTVDICHPLQTTVDRNFAPSIVALPAAPRPIAALLENAVAPTIIVPHPTRAGEAPDPPPPKTVA